jgi:hypothetical protein
MHAIVSSYAKEAIEIPNSTYKIPIKFTALKFLSSFEKIHEGLVRFHAGFVDLFIAFRGSAACKILRPRSTQDWVDFIVNFDFHPSKGVPQPAIPPLQQMPPGLTPG